MTRATARRGRPRQLVMPDPIPDTPENVARAMFDDATQVRFGTSRSPAATAT